MRFIAGFLIGLAYGLWIKFSFSKRPINKVTIQCDKEDLIDVIESKEMVDELKKELKL